MFRLKEQQLHMLIWMMVAASLLLFGVLGLERALQVEDNGSWKGLDDFSDGWICTYETSDEEKLLRYRRGNRSEEDNAKESAKVQKNDTIVEVVTFPAELSVKGDSSVVMERRVPEMNLEPVYVVLGLDNATVRVFVEDDIIYASAEKERMIPVRHVIPIHPKYKDKIMVIEISGLTDGTMEIESLQSGSYNQLWVSTLRAQAIQIASGLVLLILSVCMMVVWVVMKNTWQQKRVLLYSSVEGLLLGLLSLLHGDIVPLLTGWNYGTYILKACVIILAIVLHLVLVRCYIYKKKVLGIVDTTILMVGVFYISVMVLQVFSLVYFDTIYTIGSVLYGAMVVLFTIVLAITIFDYQRKEGMPVFIANVILILCMLAQVILHFLGRETDVENLYVCIGFVIYIGYIWIHGMKQAFYVQPKKEEIPLDESEIRAKVVEQINPNLLFASFQTLQNLIKSGSEKSVKMIYYISVYLRDNLKALEASEEVVSFAEELEHIIAYLQLQKTRNQNLNFAIECKVKEFHVPRHSLEPLVENAVKHGIANHGNSGNVAIRTYMRADGYAIQIIDDGAGFDVNLIKKRDTTVAQKLALLEKTCQARTEVISREGKGTVITIVLPMLENDLMDDSI